jgi:hemoglobin
MPARPATDDHDFQEPVMNTTPNQTLATLLIASLCLTAFTIAGCAKDEKKDRDFHTSGSRDADQRAEQRIAKTQQMRGEGASNETANIKPTLYSRLGGDKGVTRIVDDFVARVLADPSVNWERKGVKRGGVMGIGGKKNEWVPDAQHVMHLKKHLVQFIALRTGGPAKYEGRDIQETHKGMKITNAEFDAAIGDLKATLDIVKVPTEEQKELLAIMESTRPQIAEDR